MVESSKPKKQRKKLVKMPLHQRKKLVSAHLSKELREKYKKRAMPIRKGDTVTIMRGSFKGKTGKVIRVDLKKARVYVEGIVRKKTDGKEINIPLNASNLMIIALNESDEVRFKRVK